MEEFRVDYNKKSSVERKKKESDNIMAELLRLVGVKLLTQNKLFWMQIPNARKKDLSLCCSSRFRLCT